jgi:hypothetical protein
MFTALTLGACGGGGGDQDYWDILREACSNGNESACVRLADEPIQAGTDTAGNAEGFYVGSTDTNRAVFGVLLDDGTYYSLYSAIGDSSSIAGVLQGTASGRSGSLVSTDGRDFSIEFGTISNVTSSATYVAQSTYRGIVTYPQGSSISFAATYDSAYEITPTLSAIAGTYVGEAVVAAGVDSGTLTVSATGAVTGTAESGCRFTAQVKPRARGNVYNVTTEFGPAPCSNANATVSGIVYYDAVNRQLVAVGLNASRTNGFLLLGNKLEN